NPFLLRAAQNQALMNQAALNQLYYQTAVNQAASAFFTGSAAFNSPFTNPYLTGANPLAYSTLAGAASLTSNPYSSGALSSGGYGAPYGGDGGYNSPYSSRTHRPDA